MGRSWWRVRMDDLQAEKVPLRGDSFSARVSMQGSTDMANSYTNLSNRPPKTSSNN